MQATLDACRLIAAAGLVLTLAGCGGGGGQVSGSTVPGPQLYLPPPSGQYGNLVFTLTTDKQTYSPGEPVLATMAVKNTGSQTLYFDAAAGIPGLDYLIVQQGSTQVWNSTLHGGSLAGLYINVPIAPGQTMSYGPLIWNQGYDEGQMSPNNSGPQVPSGTYTLRTFTEDSFYGANVNTQAPDWYETNFAAPLATITIQ